MAVISGTKKPGGQAGDDYGGGAGGKAGGNQSAGHGEAGGAGRGGGSRGGGKREGEITTTTTRKTTKIRKKTRPAAAGAQSVEALLFPDGKRALFVGAEQRRRCCRDSDSVQHIYKHRREESADGQLTAIMIVQIMTTTAAETTTGMIMVALDAIQTIVMI
jgi:hypothetical protein